MAGIFGILDIGKSAIFGQQTAIGVTGHNIANVNTPGYSRQRAVLESGIPVMSESGLMGTGVRTKEIQRSYDKFLTLQLSTEQSTYGKLETENEIISQLESFFNDSEGQGLNSAISNFFNSFQDLANDPENSSVRSVVVARGREVSNLFNNIDSNLKKLQKSLDADIKVNLSDINRISGEIADLNLEISKIEGGNVNANDLRDRRESLLEELSQKININYFEDYNNQVTVFAGGESPIVEGINVNKLETSPNAGNSNLLDINFNNGSGSTINITNKITDGNLAGLIELRDTSIPKYIGDMDELAAGIINGVNSQHELGTGLDGSTGNAFFTALQSGLSNGAAGEMSLNPTVRDNPEKIAAALTSSSGDNQNALNIADLQSSSLLGNNTQNFSEFYASMVGELGVEANNITNYYNQQESVLTLLKNRRESVSGVSIDEELTDLIKYQNGYSAAARLISTVDKMLDEMMNMIR